MKNLPHGFKAIVLGCSGAIGAAFERKLSEMSSCGFVVGLSRQVRPVFDIEDEASIATHAQRLASEAPFHLIIDATGVLGVDKAGPEKRLADLEANRLSRAFMVNSIGPALVLKHFTALLPTRSRCVFAKLSARLGSIADNRRGGWYGYRASKAALNMLLRTAAVDVCRSRPEALIVAMQPGTVRSRLSAPYLSGVDAQQPEVAATKLLAVLDGLQPERQAVFVDYSGERVAW
jgi:NAD(P)-dependent dehydrogenase (short-subunit alcohol dehydrogenase family)